MKLRACLGSVGLQFCKGRLEHPAGSEKQSGAALELSAALALADRYLKEGFEDERGLGVFDARREIEDGFSGACDIVAVDLIGQDVYIG